MVRRRYTLYLEEAVLASVRGSYAVMTSEPIIVVAASGPEGARQAMCSCIRTISRMVPAL